MIIITFIMLLCTCFATESTCYSIVENSDIITISEEMQLPDYKGWFYEQLDEMEKTVYNGFLLNRNQLLDGNDIAIDFATNKDVELVKSSILTAKRAYLADHPADKISFDNCKLSLLIKEDYMQLFVRHKSEFDTRQAYETFEQVTDEFVQTLSGTDREKLETIHNWLIHHVQYDLTADNNGNTYGAIVGGRSVCSGFAYSFKYLADKAGLNVVYVQGYYYFNKTNTYGYHAWNMAEVDGEWVLIDVTFDSSLQNFSLFCLQDQRAYHPDALFTYPV